MNANPPSPDPEKTMLEMAAALAELRDAWVCMSALFSEMLTETDSPQRDEVLTTVERYLARLREDSHVQAPKSGEDGRDEHACDPSSPSPHTATRQPR